MGYVDINLVDPDYTVRPTWHFNQLFYFLFFIFFAFSSFAHLANNNNFLRNEEETNMKRYLKWPSDLLSQCCQSLAPVHLV